MDEITAVGKVLRRLRKEKGLSQFDLGLLTGFQQNQISQYESRGVNKLNTIKVFAEFYETTVSKIIEMAEEESSIAPGRQAQGEAASGRSAEE